MKPSCSPKAVFPLFFALVLLLQGCNQGSLKFIQDIQQSNSIIQALAGVLEKNLNNNILNQAFDLENSTRVVFTPVGQLTSKQLSLISPAAAAALMAQDTLSQTASSKTMDLLLSAVMLGNILSDNLSAFPSDKKISVTSGDFLIDNDRTYHVKKIETTKGVNGFVNRLEISLDAGGIQSVKFIAYVLPKGIRYVSFYIKKSGNETFFIEALGKWKESALALNLLNYEVKTEQYQTKDRYESKTGVSLVSLITAQLASGSDITVENVLDLSQSDDASVSEILGQIMQERNNSSIIQQALDWEHSPRVTFTSKKPLSSSQKKLMPLVSLTALLARDANQLLDSGRSKEISIMLAGCVVTMFDQMAVMPSSSTSFSEGKLLVDGHSDFKFNNASFTKKNGKSSASIEFDIGKKGSLTLEVAVSANGKLTAAFNLKASPAGRKVGMEVSASGTAQDFAIKDFSTFVWKDSNLVNSTDIAKLPGIYAEDLIKKYLLAGNFTTIGDLRSLFEREETFSASIEAATGDLASVVSDFDLGDVHVEFTGTDNVIFSYKPGDVEYTITGIINGNNISIPETSIQEAAFASETLGKCTINDAKVSGDCTIVNQNTISCSMTLTGDVVDSSPAFCFIPKDSSETSMDVVFTVD